MTAASAEIVLSPEEIIEITKKKRFTAQVRALEKLRIPFRPRDDGSPCVFRAAASQHMGVQLAGDERKVVKLNLDAL